MVKELQKNNNNNNKQKYIKKIIKMTNVQNEN